MDTSCESYRLDTASGKSRMTKASRSMNHGPWQGHVNDQRFLEALADFMEQSWTIVCQVRERAGLSASYEMSSTEIARRIEEVSRKLAGKYREVQALEAQKAQLLHKAPPKRSAQAVQRNPVSIQSQYRGSRNFAGSSGEYWSAPSAASSRRRPQFSAGASLCPPECPEYSHF